jgi:hypothetical protein
LGLCDRVWTFACRASSTSEAGEITENVWGTGGCLDELS